MIAFGGRNLGEKGPKYLNSADTPVFKKSRNLFALNFAKNAKGRAFILGEGYMDVIAMHAAGFSNAVATLGTSLTAEQARLIAHYAKEVVIAYDADGAGQTATRRAIEIFSPVGLPTRVLTVTGADPDEFIKKYGSARFKILLEKSANSTEYALNRLREQHNMSTADGRVAYLNAAAKYLAGFDNLIERDIYVSKLSEEAGVSRMALMETINSLAKKREKSEKRKQERDLKVEVFDPRDKINPQRAKYPKAALCEEKILSFLFSHPDHIRVVQKELSEDMFVTDFNRKVYRHTIEAFDQHKDLDIAYFGEDFTDEEMGRITRMFVQQSEMAYTLEDARSYIAALKEQKGKVSYDDMKQMSPQQLQEYLMQRKK